MRGGERDPGTKERSLVGRQELVASTHALVACWGVEGVVGNEVCRSGLYPRSNTCSSRTGGNQVTGLATIAAEISIRSATAFLEGEWTPSTSSAIKKENVVGTSPRAINSKRMLFRNLSEKMKIRG